MKSKISLFTLFIAVLMAACGGKKGTSETTTESEEAVEVAEVSYSVDTAASTVYWSGEVAGVYGHNGEIEIAEGAVTAAGDSITGGKILIDMTTIQPLDSASYKDEDGRRASDLVGHLSTGDFFLVEEFPTASFVITSHSGSDLVGDLTIRGITKEATATLSNLTVTPEGLTGTADLVFNRQDYEVSWVHFMKDMILSDEITIKVDLVAAP